MVKKLTVLVLVFIALLVLDSLGQDSSDLEAKLKLRVSNDYSDAQFAKLIKKKWGDYGLTFRTAQLPWGKCSGRASFTSNGDWIETVFWLQDDQIPTEIRSRLAEFGLVDVKSASFTNWAGGKSYYRLSDSKDYISLIGDDFTPLKEGIIKEKGILTENILTDLHDRFDNPVILEASLSKRTILVDVNLRLDDSYNQEGRVVYGLDDKWTTTILYMRDYVKLPLELIIFVDERGGIDNFNWIQKVITPSISYYELWFKDGSTLFLDQDLNKMEGKPNQKAK